MRLEQLTLRELHMKLVAPFQTSMETTTMRRVVLAEVVVDGVTGWGECVAGESPSYSPETTDTAWLTLRDHIWPLLKGKRVESASRVWDLLASVRGHNMAKLQSKLPYGTLRPNKKTFRFRSCSAAQDRKLQVASPLALKVHSKSLSM